jgi:phenylacetate-CoA ligase
MIKLKGTTLYPPGVFEIIHQVADVRDYVVEVFSNELGTDELRLHLFSDNPTNTETKILALFQSGLRVLPTLHFATQQEIEQLQLSGQSRKVKKFIDNRVG